LVPLRRHAVPTRLTQNTDARTVSQSRNLMSSRNLKKGPSGVGGLFEYFEQYEKNWSKESNQISVRKYTFEGLVDRSSLTGDYDEEIWSEVDGNKLVNLNTRQTIFRAAADLELGKDALLKDIRAYARSGHVKEVEPGYKKTICDLWDHYANETPTVAVDRDDQEAVQEQKLVMDSDGMKRLVCDILKEEKQAATADSLEGRFIESYDLFKEAVRLSCQREINVASKNQRAFGDKNIAREFNKQQRTINMHASRAAKIFKKNKAELGKVAAAVYTALEKDVEAIARDIIYHIKELAKAKYGIIVLPWEVPKEVITRPEFCFCFLESLDVVVNAHRPMVQDGKVYPCVFSFVKHRGKKLRDLEDWVDPAEAEWVKVKPSEGAGEPGFDEWGKVYSDGEESGEENND
jgi:hypothetical protein